jgi:hypothetical protein
MEASTGFVSNVAHASKACIYQAFDADLPIALRRSLTSKSHLSILGRKTARSGMLWYRCSTFPKYSANDTSWRKVTVQLGEASPSSIAANWQ